MVTNKRCVLGSPHVWRTCRNGGMVVGAVERWYGRWDARGRPSRRPFHRTPRRLSHRPTVPLVIRYRLAVCVGWPSRVANPCRAVRRARAFVSHGLYPVVTKALVDKGVIGPMGTDCWLVVLVDGTRWIMGARRLSHAT
jgi:hypothetical protein